MGKTRSLGTEFKGKSKKPKFEVEEEIKILFPDFESFAAAQNYFKHKGEFHPREDFRINTYSNTPDYILYQHRIDARSREHENGAYKTDFKTPIILGDSRYGQPDENGVFSRREYPIKTKSGIISLDDAKKYPELHKFLSNIGVPKGNLQAVGQAVFARDTLLLNQSYGSKTEIAFEAGWFQTLDGIRSDPVFIMEPEIKKGTIELNLLPLLYDLEERFGVVPHIYTKGQMVHQFAIEFRPEAEQKLFWSIHNEMYEDQENTVNPTGPIEAYTAA